MDSFIASFLALFGVDKIGKIPVGATAKSVVDWMKLHLSWLFDTISDGLGWLIDSTLNVLQSPHPLVVIAAHYAMVYGQDGPVEVFRVKRGKRIRIAEISSAT